MKLVLTLILLATPALADDFVYFQSPSGNINCVLMKGDYAGVRCDMTALTPSFTHRPKDCDLDWGDSFAIGAGETRGSVMCHGDTVIQPGSLVLGYGQSATLGEFSCQSEKTGITCQNALGHGFSIAKAKQTLF